MTLPRGDVFILGAGFSKAVHHGFPLLNELGEIAVSRLVSDGRLAAVPGDFDENFTFESWLASLAEPQPFLTESENADNFATFAALRDEIVEVLHSAEEEYQESDAPAWLNQLICAWECRVATVITFNYDRIIEIEALRRCLVERIGFEPRIIEVADLTNGIPPSPLGPGYLPPRRIKSMRLLKLHGSLDWLMAQNDALGTTLLRSDLQFQDFHMYDISESDLQRQFPGREPFIVPPTMSKTGYLGNLWLHQIWQDAHRSLRQAKRLVIAGYSLAAADVTAGALLYESIQRNNAEVIVVDLNPKKVIDKLRSFGIEVAKSFSGKNSLRNFVNWYLPTCASDLLAMLTPFPDHPTINPLFPPGLPLVLANYDGLDPAPFARVTDIEVDESSSTIALIADRVGNNIHNVASSDFVSDEERQITVDSLTRHIRPDFRLIARKAGDLAFPVGLDQFFGITGGLPEGAVIKVVPRRVEPLSRFVRRLRLGI